MQVQALARAGRWSLALLLFITSTAAAQVRISGGISGTVSDQTGGVVPGATVQLKDEGTGNPRETITNEQGYFAFPGPELRHLPGHGHAPGLPDRALQQGRRRSGAHDRPAREAAAGRPVRGRDRRRRDAGARDVVERHLRHAQSQGHHRAAAAGPQRLHVRAPGARRRAPAGTGSTHYNGMPGGTINPTIDGINNSSNGFKSGGTSFFGTVPARLGAIEEVTVESAGLGGDAGVRAA